MIGIRGIRRTSRVRITQPRSAEQVQHAIVDDMLRSGVINPDAAERMHAELDARFRP